jgi:Fe2+ transport system protein FeoA
MGLVGGTEVEVVKLAPLGDPMQIVVLGYHLTLRKSEAERVRVEP